MRWQNNLLATLVATTLSLGLAACAPEEGGGQDVDLTNAHGKADGSASQTLALRRDMSWYRLRSKCTNWFWCEITIKATPDDAALMKAAKYYFAQHPEQQEVRVVLYTIELTTDEKSELAGEQTDPLFMDTYDDHDIYLHARRDPLEPEGIKIMRDNGGIPRFHRDWGQWHFDLGAKDSFTLMVKLADDSLLSEFNFGDDDRVNLQFSADWF